MRLIDADKTKQLLRDRLKGEYNVVSALVEGAIVNLLDEQPTAYDVDKVVEKLRACSFEVISEDCYVSLDLDEAIDIVKRGGVDEGN